MWLEGCYWICAFMARPGIDMFRIRYLMFGLDEQNREPDPPGFVTRPAATVVNCVKVKVKFSLERATKPQRRSRGIALLFLLPQR